MKGSLEDDTQALKSGAASNGGHPGTAAAVEASLIYLRDRVGAPLKESHIRSVIVWIIYVCSCQTDLHSNCSAHERCKEFDAGCVLYERRGAKIHSASPNHHPPLNQIIICCLICRGFILPLQSLPYFSCKLCTFLDCLVSRSPKSNPRWVSRVTCVIRLPDNSART